MFLVQIYWGDLIYTIIMNAVLIAILAAIVYAVIKFIRK